MFPSNTFPIFGQGFVWWVDPSWMPVIHQTYSVTSLLSWSEEKKYNERPTGPAKDWERSLTSHHLSRLFLNSCPVLEIMKSLQSKLDIFLGTVCFS